MARFPTQIMRKTLNSMTDIPKFVSITEEGPREGFQFEQSAIPTSDKVRLIDALSQTGLKRIQVVSFVDPRRVPGMADAANVVRQMTPRDRVNYTALWFNRKGFDQAQASGRLTLEGTVRLCASAQFLQENLNRTEARHTEVVDQEIADFQSLGVPVTKALMMAAFGCNFEGEIPIARVLGQVEQALRLAEKHGLKLKTLSLADTMAWATPPAIRRVVGAIRERWPALAINLHLHDTRGMAIANAMAGLEMGVSQFDTSVAGLGGCPFAKHKGAAGNLCTEDFVFLCHELGIETGVDLEALCSCAHLAEEVVGRPLPGSIMRAGSLDHFRRSHVL